MVRWRSAVVRELQVDVEVLSLEQSDDFLQVVTLLRAHAQLVALDLGFDALGALVADDLRDLLRIVLVDALLEGRIDAVLLAGGVRFAVFQGLQRDSALDQLRLEDVENGLDPVLAVGFQLHGFAAPGDRRIGAAEVIAGVDLLRGLVECVVGFLAVDLADDVE
ncbi:hypothetical protein FHQ09_09740 [Brevibacterium sediminis]|uniref:Uncharacterized protein n=1 Tax=Brevibacterium sediminis TaxID=1857024 RepID=A0A5C4X190_9MICO|nr:hypothetical protein FHQ09_09740 [Brevibacterium sediminis]